MNDQAQLRSGVYTLLARLLALPPDAGLLARLRAIAATDEADQDETAAAWAELKWAAGEAEPAAVAEEYHELFIGLGRGELLPYGSWYKTGFLMERPLGELRRDLAALGYARPAEAAEPEDHAAALCEVMALLSGDEAVTLTTQQHFFRAHLDDWMGRFFDDLEVAEYARFYRAVGRLGSAFMKLERRYLTLLV